MDNSDEKRDQMKEMRYLLEEKKFVADLIQRLDDQRNRLVLEEMLLKKIINNQSQNNPKTEEDEELDDLSQDIDTKVSNYFCSGTPSRPIEEPIVDCFSVIDETIGHKKLKAVVEPIELDVSKVLLRLAGGGIHEEEEEEEDDN